MKLVLAALLASSLFAAVMAGGECDPSKPIPWKKAPVAAADPSKPIPWKNAPVAAAADPSKPIPWAADPSKPIPWKVG